MISTDPRHGPEIARAAGTYFNPACDRVIAREMDGGLAGGVIYSGYTGRSIGLHVAGFRDDWINKEILWTTFDYPFVQLGCEVIFGQVPSDNLRALEFDLKLGFKIVARIEDVFDGADLVVLKMRKSECRFLKMKRSAMQEAA
jgi:RimJ/RimL family protein N-acetyltransferase